MRELHRLGQRIILIIALLVSSNSRLKYILPAITLTLTFWDLGAYNGLDDDQDTLPYDHQGMALESAVDLYGVVLR